MVKHTQTIRRQFADELFECVWPFCDIGAWRIKNLLLWEMKLRQKQLSRMTPPRVFSFNLRTFSWGVIRTQLNIYYGAFLWICS